MPLLFRAHSLFKQSFVASKQLKKRFVELNDLNHVAKIVTPNSLIFFDLDNTLITPNQTIGSDQWFYWHMLKYNLNITLPIYHLAQRLTDVQLVDKSANSLIAKLRKKHNVFGLTSRGRQLMKATERQLLSVGIEFDSTDTFLKHKTSYSEDLLNRINNGVIFTGGGCKGEVLEKLHQHMTESFVENAPLTRRYFENHVVLIDDSQSKLDAFINSCNRIGLNGLAVRYTAMENRLDINPDIANFQEKTLRDESRLISDQEAHETLTMSDINKYLDSVVRVECVQLSYDYTSPRSAPKQQICSGSGFAVNDYILTNAHVISGAKYIRLKTSNMNQYFIATVEYIDHYHDVALLKVNSSKFWQNIQPLKLSKKDIFINSKLHVLGYPIGGNEICVTKGIVSRTELDSTAYYGQPIYKVQIDAAVNAGNSGGPVLSDNYVSGMVIDSIDGTNNINYMIPACVLNSVITVCKEKKLTKYKFDFEATLIKNQSIVNKVVEKDLGVYSFLLVSNIDKKNSIKMNIRKGDMIIAINGCSLLDNGLIMIDGKKLSYEHLFHFNDNLELTIIRNKRRHILAVKLIPDSPDESIESIVGDYSIPPDIYQFKNIVFQQITDCFIKQLQESESNAPKELMGFSCRESSGIVISEFLNHEDFMCYSDYLNIPISSVNNIKIKTLDDAREALKAADMITINFLNGSCILIEKPRIKAGIKLHT